MLILFDVTMRIGDFLNRENRIDYRKQGTARQAVFNGPLRIQERAAIIDRIHRKGGHGELVRKSGCHREGRGFGAENPIYDISPKLPEA